MARTRRSETIPAEAQLRTYEGMFLLDSAEAVKDWDATVGVVTGILERYGAELQLNGKWDERKLAYPVKKHKRGSYYLAYFNAPTDSIVKMRDDLQLKEEILRFLILAMPEDIPIPATLDYKVVIEDDDDDRRGGGGGGGGGGGRGGFRRERRPERSAPTSGDAPAPAADAAPVADAAKAADAAKSDAPAPAAAAANEGESA